MPAQFQFCNGLKLDPCEERGTAHSYLLGAILVIPLQRNRCEREVILLAHGITTSATIAQKMMNLKIIYFCGSCSIHPSLRWEQEISTQEKRIISVEIVSACTTKICSLTVTRIMYRRDNGWQYWWRPRQVFAWCSWRLLAGDEMPIRLVRPG